MRAGRNVVAVLVVLFATSAASAAPAAPADQSDSEAPTTTTTTTDATRDASASLRARTTFEQAREAFGRKSYVAAASAFEQSASYVPHPAPWVDAAEAWILAGDPVRAARACDRALAFSDIDDANRAQAIERLRKVSALIGTLELVGPTLTVRVDEVEALPLPTTLRLAPGEHTFRVSSESGSLRFTLDLRAGARERRVLAVRDGVPTFAGANAPPAALTPTATPSAGAEPPRRRRIPIASVAGYGVAAVATGAAVFFGLGTLDARDHYKDEGARSRFYLDRALTNVSIGVAVVAAVTSTVLWVLAKR